LKDNLDIETQENSQSTVLHSSINGGELAAVSILLNFEDYFHPEIQMKLKNENK
jgi:hypothetical protein